jgi:hypothetical protein
MGSTIETYNQKMRKFFDLLIENEHLNIGVIKSVQENARRRNSNAPLRLLRWVITREIIHLYYLQEIKREIE